MARKLVPKDNEWPDLPPVNLEDEDFWKVHLGPNIALPSSYVSPSGDGVQEAKGELYRWLNRYHWCGSVRLYNAQPTRCIVCAHLYDFSTLLAIRDGPKELRSHPQVIEVITRMLALGGRNRFELELISEETSWKGVQLCVPPTPCECGGEFDPTPWEESRRRMMEAAEEARRLDAIAEKTKKEIREFMDRQARAAGLVPRRPLAPPVPPAPGPAPQKRKGLRWWDW
jgi:hypothetical protein